MVGPLHCLVAPVYTHSSINDKKNGSTQSSPFARPLEPCMQVCTRVVSFLRRGHAHLYTCICTGATASDPTESRLSPHLVKLER